MGVVWVCVAIVVEINFIYSVLVQQCDVVPVDTWYTWSPGGTRRGNVSSTCSSGCPVFSLTARTSISPEVR